jgi:L-amino acid N-acyltransferase YncA
MAMDIDIRPVRPEDAEGIVCILNPIIEAGKYTVLDTPFTVEEEREYIAGFPERGLFFVAQDRRDGRIVGIQSLEPFATYTRAFDHVAALGTFVHLSFWRRGIGATLSAISFEAARQKGYEKIFTYVRADNPASLAFHQKLGFRVVGTARRQAKLGAIYIDEIVIEKSL